MTPTAQGIRLSAFFIRRDSFTLVSICRIGYINNLWNALSKVKASVKNELQSGGGNSAVQDVERMKKEG